MQKNKKILLIFAGIIVVILIGSVLLNRQFPVKQEEDSSLNILEGVIEDIDYENTDSFVAKIDTTDIVGVTENPMKKIIKLDESTKWTAYDQDKEKEWTVSFTEAKKGDNILVFSAEDPESINDIEKFTALKIMIFR